MNRETSKENDVLFVKEAPTKDKSPTYPPSTNPHAPTNPSKQFHYNPSTSLLSF